LQAKAIAHFISIDLGTKLTCDKVCSLNSFWQLLISLMDLYTHGNNRWYSRDNILVLRFLDWVLMAR
jgi:hypothetical protein